MTRSTLSSLTVSLSLCLKLLMEQLSWSLIKLAYWFTICFSSGLFFLGGGFPSETQKITLREVRFNPHDVWLNMKNLKNSENWHFEILILSGVQSDLTWVESHLPQRHQVSHQSDILHSLVFLFLKRLMFIFWCMDSLNWVKRTIGKISMLKVWMSVCHVQNQLKWWTIRNVSYPTRYVLMRTWRTTFKVCLLGIYIVFDFKS